MLTVASLAAYLGAAMAAWVPIEHHAYYEPRARTEARYEELATVMAYVALAEDPLPVTGREDEDRVATALLLASVAGRESFYIDSVVRCRRPGLGRAWGAWQYQGPRARVCSTLDTGARWALGMMRAGWHACAHHALEDRLAFYTDGRCEPRWQRSRQRAGRALEWARTVPVWLYSVPPS